ncbi:MAG: phosphoribosylanthranilate isomerase [Gemmatimonadota bacterium]|nr:phosphoribosylanthranilate isomerase [Gemmatimonadota bacterium]
MRVRLKVCCIASVEEARIAIEAGADAVGLVSSMPSGPGVISEESIRAIARTVPPPIATFLLTCHQRVTDIVAQQKRCGTNTVQLCDRLVEGSYDQLRAAIPGTSIVQVIHVNGRESVEEAIEIAPYVDALLLDSGNQKLPTKELGGTGRTHDWRLSAEIRRTARARVFLAGGLRAENVIAAISQVEPWGVDLCSGVRSDGRLNLAKLQQFVHHLSGR